MTTVTIFGSGKMGTAIAGIFADGGATVDHVGSADSASGSASGNALEIAGDIVVLAVPYPALQVIADRHRDQLAGKIVVDITNPLDFSTFDSLVVPAGSSAAAGLAQALPHSRVLKAFNTNFAATLTSKTIGDQRTAVLVAGDDPDAKQSLIAAVSAGGVDAIDAGSLDRAHELEALGFLQLTLAVGEKIGWTGGLGVIR